MDKTMKVLFRISRLGEKITSWADIRIWNIVHKREYTLDELYALLKTTPPGYVRFRVRSMIDARELADAQPEYITKKGD